MSIATTAGVPRAGEGVVGEGDLGTRHHLVDVRRLACPVRPAGAGEPHEPVALEGLEVETHRVVGYAQCPRQLLDGVAAATQLGHQTAA